MTFDLNDWAASFNPTSEDHPSPDWDDPVMAHRLMHEVPKLAHSIGLRPPFGWDEDCWHQELRETLIKRSRGKGKWDPTRGRTKWSSWACMVMQTRSQNLHRSTVGEKANLVRLCSIEQMNMGTLESWSGDGLPGIQSGTPKHQRTAKALQQRQRRAAQQRTRRAKAASIAVV
jgi:hypothetical protein